MEETAGLRSEMEKLKQSLASKTSLCNESEKNITMLKAHWKNTEELLKSSEAALDIERSKSAELLRRVTELETERTSFQTRWTELKSSIQ